MIVYHNDKENNNNNMTESCVLADNSLHNTNENNLSASFLYGY